MTSDQHVTPSREERGLRPYPDGSQPWPRARIPVVYGVLIGVAALVAGSVVARGQAGYWQEDGDVTVIQDFASHLAFARGVWRGAWSAGHAAAAGESAYSVEAHLRIMSEWMGREASIALPFGYSPTMIWVLLPLTLISIPLAYVLWTAAGALAAARMVSSARFHWVVALMALLTPVAAGAMALGQTAILGTAGMYFLAHRTLSASAARRAWLTGDALALAAVLWALGAKPPLALTAGVAMVGLGFIGPVALAVVLTLLGAVFVTAFLGHGWPADYATLIGTYDRVAADPAFAWSLRPDHMSNLRAFLFVDLGVSDDLASRASNLVWIASLGLTAVAGHRRWIQPPVVWAMAILSYLLFCSHVSSTDEVLLMVVPALVLPWGTQPRGGVDYLPWIVVPAGLLLSPALGPAAGLRPSLLWFVEIGLAAWLILSVFLLQRRTPRGAAT